MGCSKYSLESRINLANTITKTNNFKLQDIQTHHFKLRTYTKLEDRTKPLKIYIEGDGFAWIDRYTKSTNPTPINPVALKLAINSEDKNIAYIARPCQYVSSSNCSSKYWTNKRFSKEVVESINMAISKLKEQSLSNDIELVGFSGGAAIATLVASLRNDVKSITTIAGNLNHVLLNQHHNVSELVGSLNPIDIASKISHIPQIHYVGENDKVVPRKIADSFKKASSNSRNIKVKIVPNVTHTSGWDKLLI